MATRRVIKTARRRRRAAKSVDAPVVRGVGTKLGMSLARIYESGTTKFRARPVFSTVLAASEPSASEIVARGYEQAIDYLWRQK